MCRIINIIVIYFIIITTYLCRSRDGLQPQRSTNLIGIRPRHEKVNLTDYYNKMYLLSPSYDIKMV